eukprot:Opistho-2@23992
MMSDDDEIELISDPYGPLRFVDEERRAGLGSPAATRASSATPTAQSSLGKKSSSRPVSRQMSRQRSLSVMERADADATAGEEGVAPDECVLDNGQGRIIYTNDALKNAPSQFSDNKIHTGKYNVFTFLPRFLFDQFSRYANLFFLFIACIQQIGDVSPTGQYTTAVPLLLVLSATAVKEIIEDWRRHKSDDEVNNRQTRVLRGGVFERLRWTDVCVGDIVKVSNGKFFPADLLLLSSSEPQGMCYIETSNLDGETNLKIRQGLPQFAKLTSPREVRSLHGIITCEHPNNSLHTFVGNIRESSSGMAVPLGPTQLLLRGAQLRNTPWIYGVAVFTGHDTKLMRNQTVAPMKRSHVDHVTNRQIIYLFLVLVGMSLFLCDWRCCVVGKARKGPFISIWTAAAAGISFLRFLRSSSCLTISFRYRSL